jgi:uncharacterized protein (DUF305 family)
MNRICDFIGSRFFVQRWLPQALAAVMLGGLTTGGIAQAPIVQPGAPGEPSRQISAEDAVALATIRYSAADVRFMQDMIPHHQQALDMAALVSERTSRNEMIELARRIETTQKDEIAFMRGWLNQRNEPLPDPDAHLDHHHEHAHHTMEGMASPEQMAELEAARGEAFDTQFLQLMIKHHEGALVMVKDLLEAPGSAQEPAFFEFTTEVTTEQEAEIKRMSEMLAGFSPDPRAGLAAGFRDAEQALLNMELLASLPKPDGFYDPENPAGLPASRLRDLQPADDDDDENADDEAADKEEEDEQSRPALLDFANTDMAFLDNVLVVGSYHGFNLYDISNGGMPELASSVVCPGGQGDVSVVGNLLILSVEQNRGRLDCGLKGVAGDVSDERFRGLRIFDISDITMPVHVGAVQTCRGSHTHTVVAGPGEDGRLIVYNSGTAPVRDEEELEGCLDESPWRDERTALFRIDVIEIPVNRPSEARIIHSPAVFADPETGILAGLWERGDHGPDTQITAETNHCHDITVFPESGIAAGACSGNGILFDISDPINPTRIDEVVDTGFAYWHSATFNNQGDKVIFTDEWGGGTRARCRASDPLTWGANAIYDIVDNKLVFRGYFKMPAPQTDQENCVAHNGSLVPVPGRDIMVQAWYQGGISVFDFTDSANPIEIAYFDRGPIDEEELITGGFWSSYWYQGLVYGSEIVRGLDVLSLTPSEYLSENELAAALLADKGSAFNPQQQYQVNWPADPVVARAYRDQLLRTGHLSGDQESALNNLLDHADLHLKEGRTDPDLADQLQAMSIALTESSRNLEGRTRQRLMALGETMMGIGSLIR